MSEATEPGPPATDAALRDKYDGYYADGQSEWRRLGAIDKVRNIQRLCDGLGLREVIEVGAGEGSVLQRLHEVGLAPALYGLEISRSGLAAIESRDIPTLREAQLFDGYAVPYPSGRFDLAIATHVLEHVEHERLFLRELARIAGHVFVEVPLEDTLRITVSLRNDIGHINFYRRETLLALLRSSGLEPLRWEVRDYSLALGSYHLGRFKGLLRQVARRGALRLLPRVAQQLFTYHCAVLCRSTSS